MRMVRGAVALGHRTVVFKPHPTAPARWSRVLEKEAERLGAELTVLDSPVLAEVLYQRMRPALVVGCFSTALLTACAFYGLPVARIGTEVAAGATDAVSEQQPGAGDHRGRAAAGPGGREGGRRLVAAGRERAGRQLTGLITAVGFAMQAQIYPDLRPAAERYLATELDHAPGATSSAAG